MKAVILAEGLGSRLLPLTNTIPKPLIPIGQYPVLEHTLRFLKENKITEIYISVHHLKEQIKNYFEDGKRLEVTIKFIEPNKLLGTAGALNLIRDELPDRFIVLYCDYLMKFDIKSVIKYHTTQPSNVIATIVTSRYYQPEICDHFITNSNNEITGVINRPHPVNVAIKNCSNRGIYVCNKELFDYMPSSDEVSFEKDLFPKIINSKKNIIHAYMTNEYITDMGTPAGLEKVRTDYTLRKHFEKGIDLGPEYFSIN